jgi:hypothetical protein
MKVGKLLMLVGARRARQERIAIRAVFMRTSIDRAGTRAVRRRRLRPVREGT